MRERARHMDRNTDMATTEMTITKSSPSLSPSPVQEGGSGREEGVGGGRVAGRRKRGMGREGEERQKGKGRREVQEGGWGCMCVGGEGGEREGHGRGEGGGGEGRGKVGRERGEVAGRGRKEGRVIDYQFPVQVCTRVVLG